MDADRRAKTAEHSTKLRVGLAVPTAALRATMELWLDAISVVSVEFSEASLERVDACGTDVVLAELPLPIARERAQVESFLRTGVQTRLVILSFYAEAWRAALSTPRTTIFDLGSAHASDLRAAVVGVGGREPGLVRSPARTLRLSDRDRQILELVARGEKNAAIARSLNSSSRTIQARMSALMKQHGVTSRAALMARMGALLEATTLVGPNDASSESWLSSRLGVP